MRDYRTGLLPRVVTHRLSFLRPAVPFPAHCTGFVWLCVQSPFRMEGFSPLANSLLSTFSAACLLSQALFEGFPDTMKLSDSLLPFIMAVPFCGSPCGPSFMASRRASRFPCMELAYMPWFSDSAGPVRHSRYRGGPCCLPHQITRSATRIR